MHPQLKSVQLKTLNRERAEMVIDRWLATGHMSTAFEVRGGHGDVTVCMLTE